MNKIRYVLRGFRKSDEFVGQEMELVLPPGLLRELLGVEASDPMYDSYPVDALQLHQLGVHLPGHRFDPDRMDYFVESYSEPDAP